MKTADISVECIDHMGSDLSVVNAARVSFDKKSDWDYGEVEIRPDPCDPEARVWVAPKTLKATDARLISYLAKHNHWSPFAHTSVQFRVKAPIFVARQLVKHQVGGVWNEVSRRYVDSEPEFYFPATWRGRPVNAKQGSDGVVDRQTHHQVRLPCASEGEPLWFTTSDLVHQCLLHYQQMLKDGIAPEQARMVLPQNTMTEWIWTGSLVFWARVCKLRLDAHAQQETSVVARQINELVQPLFPMSWAALME